MSFLWHKPRAVFAREGNDRGSVQRLSAASPQVLLLLKGSLKTHGAWRLRLVEGCLLFFSVPSAARGYLLPPLNFSRLHALCVRSLVLCPQSFSPSPLAACGRDACFPVRGTGAATLREPLTW